MFTRGDDPPRLGCREDSWLGDPRRQAGDCGMRDTFSNSSKSTASHSDTAQQPRFS